MILRDAGLEQTDFLVLRVHSQLALRLRLHQPALELPLQGVLFLPVLPVQTLQVLLVLMQQVLVQGLLLQKLQFEFVAGLLVLLPEQVLLLLEGDVGLLQRLGLLAQVCDLAVLLLDVVAHLREPALVLLNHKSRFVQRSLLLTRIVLHEQQLLFVLPDLGLALLDDLLQGLEPLAG